VALFQIKSVFSCHDSRVWPHDTRNLLVAEGVYTNSASVEDNARPANGHGAPARKSGAGSVNALLARSSIGYSLNDTPLPKSKNDRGFPKAALPCVMPKPCDWLRPIHRSAFLAGHTRSSAMVCISNSGAKSGWCISWQSNRFAARKRTFSIQCCLKDESAMSDGVRPLPPFHPQSKSILWPLFLMVFGARKLSRNRTAGSINDVISICLPISCAARASDGIGYGAADYEIICLRQAKQWSLPKTKTIWKQPDQQFADWLVVRRVHRISANKLWSFWNENRISAPIFAIQDCICQLLPMPLNQPDRWFAKRPEPREHRRLCFYAQPLFCGSRSPSSATVIINQINWNIPKFSLRWLARACPRMFRRHIWIARHKTDWKE